MPASVLVGIAWLLTSISGSAAELAGPPAPDLRRGDQVDPAPPSGDGRRTLAALPKNLLRNLGGLVSTDNALPVLIGGGATALAFPLDDSVREELSGSDLGGLQSFGDHLGDAPVVVPLTASLFVAGRITGNQRFRDATYDLAQSQILTVAIGAGLKEIVGRERPNGTNTRSFPSGHSYSWFAIATVVERHYGFPAALPAFGLWTITGLSRVANDTHYISDMVGGAALGYLVARTTKRVNDADVKTGRPQPRAQVWPGVPAGDSGLGLFVRVDF